LILFLSFIKIQTMRIFYFLIPIAFFAACSGGKETSNVKAEKKLPAIAKVISQDAMFMPDSAKAAVKISDPRQKAESRKLFLQGLDLLANKNQAKESIDLFKESILYYPDEKNYIHLIKAYIETADTLMADSVNTFLANFEDIPYYEISFNDALISALKKDTSDVLMHIDEAIMEGFLFKERITEEKHFAFLKDNIRFTSMIVQVFNDDEKLRSLLFKAFVKYYPDVELPLEISHDSARVFNFDKYINYDYATFIPGMDEGRFARDVSNDYCLIGKLKLEGGYAFLYKSYLAIADTLNPVKSYVVTYDTLGKMIGNEMIGCFCTPSESKSFVINPDLSITITDYSSHWEFDPLEKGYAGNKIVSTEEEKKSKLIISQDGALKQEEIAKVEGSGNNGG
jgi:hypothetical protein